MQHVKSDLNSPLYMSAGLQISDSWRWKLASSSLIRAKARIESQRHLADVPLTDIVQQKKNILHRIEVYDHIGTQSGFSRAVSGLKFDGLSKLVAIGDLGGNLKILKVDSLETVADFGAVHSGALSGLAWVPQPPSDPFGDGSSALCLVTSGLEGSIKLWNSHECLGSLEGHTNRIPNISIHHDGHFLASASFDHKWKLWDLNTRQILTENEHPSEVFDVKFHPDGALICSVGFDKVPRVWDLRCDRSIMVLHGHRGSIYSTDFATNGHELVTAGADGQAIIWDLRKCAPTFVIPAHNSTISKTRFHSSGSILITSSYDKTVKIWSTDNWALCTVLDEPDKVTSVDISHDLSQILTGRFDRCVTLWEQAIAKS